MNDARDTHADGPSHAALTFRALRRYPDRVAFAWDGGAITYAATLDLIARMQAALQAAGVRHGMHLALVAGNRAEAWCAGGAAQALGAVVTWLHPLGSLDDHLEQLADAGAEALIVDLPAFRDRGGELAARSGLRTVLTLGPGEYGADLLAAAEAAGTAEARDLTRPEDPSSLAYTGGTTGKSKGVLRRHRAMVAITQGVLTDFELPDAPRYLAVAPITHVAGTKVVPSLLLGGTIHLQRGFDPERVLAAIARARISMTVLVPTMIYILLDHPKLDGTDLSSLQLLLYGASPMSPARLAEGLARIGPVFSQLYGQTECYPISTLRRADHDAGRPELFASCGVPGAGSTVSLRDDDDHEVAPGEAGEICVRSASVMDGYWNRPEETRAALRGGWLRTGDIARADERGYLFIVDRRKDMIVSGGFNVFPREIEDILSSHDAVAMAAVIGAPDPKWGEAVTALVVPRAGATVTEAELMQLVRDRKGARQAPKRVEFVDTLPLTPVGKVDKKALRAQAWAGRERMVG